MCLDVVATLLACGGSFGADVSEDYGGVLEAVDSVVAGTDEEEYWTYVYKRVSF